MRYAKTVVIMAVGIGLYYLLGRFAAIPGPVPGTFLTMQFAVLAVLAALSGSVTGGLTGTWETDGLTFRCTLAGVRYTGAMTQALDSKENEWVACFTALDETGAALWGSHAAHEK